MTTNAKEPDGVDVERIAKTVSSPMLILLNQHAEGYRSSLYMTQWVNDPVSPYWASLNCPYDPPKYHVREALISRGLIESYSDAAGITPLGKVVRERLLNQQARP